MLYKIAKPIVWLFNLLFIHPKVIGKENILQEGRVIIAGNHVHLFDPLPLMVLSKRPIHFLAKASLFKYPQGIIFRHLNLIKVKRDGNDGKALEEAINYLNNDKVIGIFPEGTRERGRGQLPFKYGAVKMANETNTLIIPFAIIGSFNPFKKLIYVFDKPFQVSGNIEKDNKELEKIVSKLIKTYKVSS